MKYRKKPIIIEAEQFVSLYWHEMTPHTEDSPLNAVCLRPDRTMAERDNEHPGAHAAPHVHTLEGFLTITDGDWIIRGIKGEFYPVKPEIFTATYEPVSDTTDETTRPPKAPQTAQMALETELDVLVIARQTPR